MNEALFSLYSQLNVFNIVDEYNKTAEDDYKTACPLFIKSNEGYEKASKKLMIFGQETNGSLSPIPYSSSISVDKIMKGYEDFFSGKRCYTYGGHFWDGVKLFITKLQEKCPNEKVDYIWNNIVKMGYNGEKKNFPDRFYDTIVKPKLNELINKEIDILKPDYIVFFTGPDYDRILNDVFGTLEFKPVNDDFTERQLSTFIIPSVKKAFRTYHPRYLCFEGRDFKDKIYDKIIEEIAK
jgi:hypothetical protein